MEGPTLADIAEQAGVSQATVSRMLNDKPGVSEATRQAVLTALDVLGYVRPAHLRPITTGMIGLIVPELVNPIFAAYAQAVETDTARAGFATLVCTQAPGGMREDQYFEVLRSRQAAGIIVVSGSHADTTADLSTYRSLIDVGLPMVLVNGFAPGVEAPFISDDDASAMDQAVDHLATLGHRRIGLALGPQRYVPVRRKEVGFRAAMIRRFGTDEGTRVAYSIYSATGGGQAAADLLGEGVTAIICASDIMAMGAIRSIRAHGLSVPGDVSVIGCDDSPVSRYWDPGVTSVRQNVDLIASMAVSTLVGQIHGESPATGERLVRPDLVIRSTTGPARG